MHPQPFQRMTRRRLALMMLLVLAITPWLPEAPFQPASAIAQTTTARFGLRAALGSAGFAEDVAVGDVNRDGYLDVVQVNADPYPVLTGPTLLYLNNGTPTPFRNVIGLPVGENGRYLSVALGDIDGDGWLDLVRGGPSQTQIFFNNRGNTGFNPTPLAVGKPGEFAVALGDFDSNGWLDLVAGGEVLLNDGTQPALANAIPQPLPPLAINSPRLATIAVADVNGDGKLDLVGCGASLVLYTNSGTTTPFGAQSQRTLGGSCRDVTLGSVDSNQSIDIIAAMVGSNSLASLLVYPNNGTQSPFSSPTAGPYGSPSDYEALELADLDADGDLDILAANQEAPGRLFVNTSNLQFTQQSFGNAQTLAGMAVGDLDRDGDPDVVLANMNAASATLVNSGPYAPFGSRTTLFGADAATQATALGDIDGVNGLDLVVTTNTEVSIYLNSGQSNPYSAAPQTLPLSGKFLALALGDVSGDGRLDLVAANNLYLNNGTGQPFANVTPQPIINDTGTWYVALGDLDNDGRLDMVHSDYVYLNNGTQTPFAQGGARLQTLLATSSLRVALGDLDNDGDLDIVRSNGAPRSPAALQIFLNSGTNNPFENVEPRSLGPLVTGGNVLLADLDGDGWLDLVHTPFVQGAAQVYLNTRTYTLFGGTTGATFGTGQSVASLRAADTDDDSDLDLMIGRTNGVVDLFRNNGTAAPFEDVDATTVPAAATGEAMIELGDVDRDGAVDLVRATKGARTELLANTLHAARTANKPPLVSDVRLGTGGGALLYGSSTILEGSNPNLGPGVIPVTYALSDAEGDRVQRIRAFYSLDGGGSWRPARPKDLRSTEGLVAFPTPTQQSFLWDIWANGDEAAALFGTSDNLVFRIEAEPSALTPPAFAAPPGASTSLPYRVRGALPRVVLNGAPLAGASVFRLPRGEASGAQLMTSRTDPVMLALTDRNGYLYAREPLRAGDRLVAVQEIQRDDVATIYATSAAPTPDGLAAGAISAPGTQTLAVSQGNLLVALSLQISLEWDARGDTAFLTRLKNDLLRTSSYLYDWSDGQVALGTVVINHDKQRWYDLRNDEGRITQKGADLRIYATNRLRPSASQGGIVREETPDPDVPAQVYEPGPVQIGAVWNRDGTPVQLETSSDWSRALAHELGHYALFLDDNYLGLDDRGRLIGVDGCPGAMSDPYRDEYSEFHPAEGWLTPCGATLSQRTTGRSDWATIERFLSGNGFQLRGPRTFNGNPGPSVLPLAVTQFAEPGASGTVRASPTLSVAGASSAARAVLFSGDAKLIDLGQPANGLVVARGVAPTDRVCVFDLPEGRLGCAAANSTTITLRSRPDWQPDVVISEVTSRTVRLAVAAGGVGAPPNELQARVFPLDSTQAAQTVVLGRSANGSAYSGTVSFADAVTEAAIHVFVAGDTAPAREVVTGYTLGGNPAPRIRPRPRSRRRSPMTSADGSLVLYTDATNFATGQFFTIQTTTALPPDPPTAVPIGPGYRLLASDKTLFSRPVGLTLAYAETDFPAGTENGIAVYYQPPGGAWERLDSRLDTADNEVVVQAKGEGLYVLMASALWQLSAGLGQYAYPGATAPLPDALAPLSGSYTHIYGYDASDTADPWKAYVPGAPPWVNQSDDGTLELPQLVVGENYWINVSRALAAPYKPRDKAAPQVVLPPPPALFYGVLKPDGGFVPRAGDTLTAVVAGKPCASTVTRQVGSDVVYVIDIPAANCGFTDAPMEFVIGDYTLPGRLPWDNTLLNGRVAPSLFLPRTTR